MRKYCIKCAKWLEEKDTIVVIKKHDNHKIELPGCRLCGRATLKAGELPLSIAKVAIKTASRAETTAILLKHGRKKLKLRKLNLPTEQIKTQETNNE